MSLIVHPDPEQPAGGYAFLELPGGSLPDGKVTVAVREVYGERWLGRSEAEGDRIAAGDPHWQSERHEFGPYDVHRHDGADWVRIGPEIVNKLEEYTPLRIEVAGGAHDVNWPDDVPPRAGAAVVGGIQTVVKPKPAEDRDAFLEKLRESSEPPVVVDPGPLADDFDDAPDIDDFEDVEDRSGSLPWVMVLLVVILVALGIWYVFFFSGEDVAEAPEPEPPVISQGTTPVADAGQCGYERLRGLAGGFPVIAEAIRTCGADIPADTALRLIEDAAAADDGDALFLFGTLYDGLALDPKIENLIGLTFDDDPVQATEYYGRALAAGSAEAQDRLARSCERIAGSRATLAKGAYDDFCR